MSCPWSLLLITMRKAGDMPGMGPARVLLRKCVRSREENGEN